MGSEATRRWVWGSDSWEKVGGRDSGRDGGSEELGTGVQVAGVGGREEERREGLEGRSVREVVGLVALVEKA